MRSKRNSNNGFSIRYFLLHPAVWFLVATGTLTYSGIAAWHSYREKFLNHERYVLVDSKLNVSQGPHWALPLVADIKQSLIDDRQSLLDPSLVPVVREILTQTPWIREIERIQKSNHGLDVVLNYRQPTALLEPIRAAALIVDGDGILFDESLFDTAEAARVRNSLLRINMPRLDLNNALPWHFIADDRVSAASRLAEIVLPVKDKFELYRLVTRAIKSNAPSANPQFELWTTNGTTVIWGSAPGAEKANEATVSQKFAAIDAYIAQFGSLKNFDHRNSHAIDVTTGKPVVIKYARIASKNSWLNQIK